MNRTDFIGQLLATFITFGIAVALAGQPTSAASAADAADAHAFALKSTWGQSVRPTRAELNAATPTEQAQGVATCTRLRVGLYCLGLGFRDTVPDYAGMLANSDDGNFAPMGDQPFASWVASRVAMPTTVRESLEKSELATAIASQDKEAAIQSELAAIEAGNPLTTVDSTKQQAATKSLRGFVAACCGDPEGQFKFIMGGYTTAQNQSNWCGPATFQMMDWADDGTKESQALKADLLGTTSSGTSITSMVSHTNTNTGWDNNAGTYIVQGIGSWDADKFWGTHVAHIGDTTPAPIIEHPEEWQQYFAYLSHDGDGHFQVGRGYQLLTGDTTRYIGIFDPWNEADWYTGGNTTWGAHLVATSRMLGATKANSLQNIGM